MMVPVWVCAKSNARLHPALVYTYGAQIKLIENDDCMRSPHFQQIDFPHLVRPCRHYPGLVCILILRPCSKQHRQQLEYSNHDSESDSESD